MSLALVAASSSTSSALLVAGLSSSSPGEEEEEDVPTMITKCVSVEALGCADALADIASTNHSSRQSVFRGLLKCDLSVPLQDSHSCIVHPVMGIRECCFHRLDLHQDIGGFTNLQGVYHIDLFTYLFTYNHLSLSTR
jgi:hypothetical protein